MTARMFLTWLLIWTSFSGWSGQENISADHKDWLEMVRPIMTQAEADIFEKLATKADRDKFIQFFWKQRDPIPETPENEFRKEFEERVRFADQTFHSGTGRRGSRTERGYYYLALGKPLERHLFTTQSQMWPLELWYCQGDQRFALPPYFYLLFYQPEGLGDYRLYHPAVEGPEKLVIPLVFGQTLNRQNAYKFLRNVSTEVASASLSYIPGEGSDRTMGLASLGSETVINAARNLAEKKFNDAYARTFADYKNYVETDYSDNYVGANAVVKLFSQGGQSFLHWSVEPDRISFGQSAEAFYTAYEIVFKLETKDGTALLERTEEVPIRLTPDQYKAHERRHLAFQDFLPVIAGDLRLFVLLKNKTGKDFTSFSAAVSVRPETAELRASNLLLYHVREAAPPGGSPKMGAFTFDSGRYVFNARNEFLPQESLGGFLQVFPGKATIPEGAEFKLDLIAVDKIAPAASRTLPWKSAGTSAGRDIDIGPIPLAGVGPGYYRAELSLVGTDGRVLLAQKENFVVLAGPAPVLPWIFSRQHAPFPSAEHLVLLGSQYFMTRDYRMARDRARAALNLKDEPAARLLLGRASYALTEYQASLQAVEPLYQAGKNREAGKIMALDYAAEGIWPQALGILEELMKEATEVAVLNLAAEGYDKTGQPAKAIPLLEKSLSLVPDQPAIKERLDRLRK